MPILDQTSSVTRNWTGVETIFTTNMVALDASHVVVKTATDTLVRNTHYSSELDLNSKLVVRPLVGMPAAPQVLTIERNTPAIQPDDLTNTNTYDADAQETQLNRVILVSQENTRRATNAEAAALQAVENIGAVAQDGPVQTVNGQSGFVVVDKDTLGLGDAERTCATRAVMKDVSTNAAAILLTEANRAGRFLWTTGDFSAQIAADTAEGIYIKSNLAAATVGAWVREDADVWNPWWFGCKASFTAAANVAALTAMLATAAVAGDTHIEFRNGYYRFNAKVTQATVYKLTLSCRTRHAAKLAWTSADGGLDLSYGIDTNPTDVINIAFRTEVAGGGTPVKITAPNSPYVTGAGAMLENVDCRGLDKATHYWTTGPHYKNVWYSQTFRPTGAGKDNTFDQADFLIYEDCQAPQMRDPVIFHVHTAIRATGSVHGEGMNFSGGEIVGVYRGIYWNIGVFKPCIGIHGMHINAEFRCITLVNVGQIDISKVLLYDTQTGSADWQGLELNNCHGCTVRAKGARTGNTGGTGNLITLTNSSDNVVDAALGEDWVGAGALVLLAGSSDRNKVRCIDVGRLPGTMVPVSFFALTGKANVFENIEQGARTPFADGDTTPSVGNSINGQYQADNSAATSITFFDDGFDGQIITVLGNNANTTIIFSGSMITRPPGFGNISIPNGGIVSFRNEGGPAGLWREITRNF